MANAQAGAQLLDAHTVLAAHSIIEGRKNGAAFPGFKIEREWPEPLEADAFHGLAGEIVRELEPQTEADSAAILLQILVSFGALLGRGPHVPIEGDQHHSNLYALLIGDTAIARKGTSWGRVREIFSRCTEWPKVVEGLSSGEGLKWNVRDGNEGDSGVVDKRLLVVESEFAQVLRQVARAGNTLSPTIRSAWDKGDLATLTKNEPVAATGAHICIIGHITAEELRAELTATDQANGFANRFIFQCVKRSKSLPFGGKPLSKELAGKYAQRVASAAGKARILNEVDLDAEAREAWAAVYQVLSEGYSGLLGAVTARAAPQCLRLALIYALMDESREIRREHVMASLAVWERADASAKYIFGSALGDPVADEIVRNLKASPIGLTRTDISRLFRGHKSAERLGMALDLIERRGLAQRETAFTEGAPLERWVARNEK